MSPIFRSDKCIKSSQVIQDEMGVINIYVIPALGYAKEHRDRILSEVNGRVGSSLSVKLFEVDYIPKEPNGKFRPVKSFFNPTSS